MLHVELQPRWHFHDGSGRSLEATRLLSLLTAIRDAGSIAQAAREVGLSYRNAWGLILDAETLLGQPLVQRARGKGTTLSDAGLRLVWSDARVLARLQPLLASLASELTAEFECLPPTPLTVPRLHASHGFAIAALHDQLQAHGIQVDLRYRGSVEALTALAHGECDLAGFHVPVGKLRQTALQAYHEWLRPSEHVFIHLALRTLGLFVAKGNPLHIHGFPDLNRPSLRFVNRPMGSGTRMLTDLLLSESRVSPKHIQGYHTTELTHSAVAAFVASGMADVGFGVETAAFRFGLTFIPVIREEYFFALRRRDVDDARLTRILDVLRSRSFKATVASLKGYDSAKTGQAQAL